MWQQLNTNLTCNSQQNNSIQFNMHFTVSLKFLPGDKVLYWILYKRNFEEFLQLSATLNTLLVLSKCIYNKG